jgi:predicted DNA-binding transcriptional regulator AlpA
VTKGALKSSVARVEAVLLPAPQVAEEFGVTKRTITRWLTSDEMGFPRPLKINHRMYFISGEIAAWRDRQLRVALGLAVPP